MSSDERGAPTREWLLGALALAQRDLSDAMVLYHSVAAEKLGLGASDWKTLGLLERHGPLTTGDLVTHSGLAPSSITGIVDRLEHGGWVRRSRDPEDRRRVVVELDHEALVRQRDEFFAGLLRRLDALHQQYSDQELATLLDYMRALALAQKEATTELTRVE